MTLNPHERCFEIAHLDVKNIEHALFSGHLYFVGELPDGRCVAFSNDAPYFCFTAATRAEARDCGVAALRALAGPEPDPTLTAGALA